MFGLQPVKKYLSFTKQYKLRRDKYEEFVEWQIRKGNG